MKPLTLVLFILFAQKSYSFEIFSFHKDIDVSQFKAKRMHFQKKNQPFLSAVDRNYFLDKYFGKNISTYNNFKRDFLYKKLLMYPRSKVIKQYPFITKESHSKIKKELLAHPIHHRFNFTHNFYKVKKH